MDYKTCFKKFREIRSICEDPGRDKAKLDEIHKVADQMVNSIEASNVKLICSVRSNLSLGSYLSTAVEVLTYAVGRWNAGEKLKGGLGEAKDWREHLQAYLDFNEVRFAKLRGDPRLEFANAGFFFYWDHEPLVFIEEA